MSWERYKISAKVMITSSGKIKSFRESMDFLGFRSFRISLAILRVENRIHLNGRRSRKMLKEPRLKWAFLDKAY